MTLAQSFKIYEVLGKYFSNADDAKVIVTEIEEIIETKFTEKKDVLVTKEDLAKMQTSFKEDMAKLREDNLKHQIDVEKRFNQLIIWIVGTAIALGGLIIAVTKL